MSDDDIASTLGSLIGSARVSKDDTFSIPLPSTVFTLNDSQDAAVRRILFWRRDPRAPRFMALTGPAGTGKTTCLQSIRAKLVGSRTAWAAMTGKAASRMREAAGVNGKTLHSVLYNPPREIDNRVDERIELNFDSVKDSGRGVLLILDEASMVSPRIRADIENSSYQKVLFVGDPYQIPPVMKGEGNERDDYSVFSEVERAELTEVMRNAGAVLSAATHVREKQEILTKGFENGGSRYDYWSASNYDVAAGLAIQQWIDDPKDHVLITWRNDVRNLVSSTIRKRLGRTDTLPEPGEPMIVRRNVYGTGLMNGDRVEIDEWLDDGPTLCDIVTRYVRVKVEGGTPVVLLVPTQRFDGTMQYVGLDKWKRAIARAGSDDPTPLTWAYCLTCHLAQGSEYRRVTTFLMGDMNNPHFFKQTTLPSGERMPFSMRFLYTALSRARQHTSLVMS